MRIKYFILILFLLFNLITQANEKKIVLNMDKYLSMVKEKNRDINIVDMELEKAEQSVKKIRSDLLPHVFAKAGYTRNLSSQYLYANLNLNLPGMSGTSKFRVNYDNEFLLHGGVKQKVFSSKNNNKLKAAKQMKKSVGFLSLRAKDKILTAAKKLFLSAVVLKENLEVVTQSKKNAYENYVQMKKKYDCGQVSKLQILLSEVRWKESEPKVIEVKRALASVKNNLKILATIDMDSDIEVQGELAEEKIDNINEPLENILTNRVDYKAKQEELNYKKSVYKAVKGTRLPEVDASFSYTYSAMSNDIKLEHDNNLLKLGLSVTMPFYTGGAIKAEVAKSKIEIKKAEKKLLKFKDEIARNNTNLKIQLDELKNKIILYKKIYETAKKAFEISEISAKEGLTTQLELKESRNQLDGSKILFLKSIFDYNCCIFDLILEQGRKVN